MMCEWTVRSSGTNVDLMKVERSGFSQLQKLLYSNHDGGGDKPRNEPTAKQLISL